MFEPRIKIPKDLYERLREEAERRGYSSVEEFVIHILEKAAQSSSEPPPDAKLIEEQLKGLGYLD